MSDPFQVKIRPYTLDDAPALYEAVRESVRDLGAWMPWCHESFSIDESREWVAGRIPAFESGSSFEFAIVANDGRYLGGCGLNQLDKEHRRANLGYWVRSSALRRGVATNAAHLLRDWGFQHTDLIRLELVIAVGNVASQGVARKSGAVF